MRCDWCGARLADATGRVMWDLFTIRPPAGGEPQLVLVCYDGCPLVDLPPRVNR